MCTSFVSLRSISKKWTTWAIKESIFYVHNDGRSGVKWFFNLVTSCKVQKKMFMPDLRSIPWCYGIGLPFPGKWVLIHGVWTHHSVACHLLSILNLCIRFINPTMNSFLSYSYAVWRSASSWAWCSFNWYGSARICVSTTTWSQKFWNDLVRTLLY